MSTSRTHGDAAVSAPNLCQIARHRGRRRVVEYKANPEWQPSRTDEKTSAADLAGVDDERTGHYRRGIAGLTACRNSRSLGQIEHADTPTALPQPRVIRA